LKRKDLIDFSTIEGLKKQCDHLYNAGSACRVGFENLLVIIGFIYATFFISLWCKAPGQWFNIHHV